MRNGALQRITTKKKVHALTCWMVSWVLSPGVWYLGIFITAACKARHVLPKDNLEVGIKRFCIRRSGDIASVRKQETKKTKSVRNRATNSISN